MDSSGESANDDDLHIPIVSERLAQLRPSKQLLDFYRRKVAEFDDEHLLMSQKLDSYRCTYEEQHKLQWELRQREDEIAELQKALSDMQVYLFQEREQVLRLYAENDRLKIKELDDRKKIQHLLSLTKPTDKEVTYFIESHPRPLSAQKSITKKHSLSRDRGPGGHKRGTPLKKEKPTHPTSLDQQSLLLNIESLQAQIEEQTELANEQLSALTEERQVRLEEQCVQRERDSDKIKSLTDHLHKTQSLLYESTKDFLDSKYESRRKERKWVHERDRILQDLDQLRDQLDSSRAEVTQANQTVLALNETRQHRNVDSKSPSSRSHGSTLASIKSRLHQSNKLTEMYREQIIGLEDELSRLREENDVGKELFKERTSKLTKRLKLVNQRYTSLDKRRSLEVEGFKNDMKILRKRLKDVEKQLFMVTVNLGDHYDMEILKSIEGTAGRSKKIVDELHGLKSKVYSLENSLKMM